MAQEQKTIFFAVWLIVNFLTMVQQKHGFYQSTLCERNRIIFYYNIYQDIPLQVKIVTMNNLIKLICINVRDLNSIIKRRKKIEKNCQVPSRHQEMYFRGARTIIQTKLV